VRLTAEVSRWDALSPRTLSEAGQLSCAYQHPGARIASSPSRATLGGQRGLSNRPKAHPRPRPVYRAEKGGRTVGEGVGLLLVNERVACA
jgi:hypothetical protein